ncbi:MAG: hypothetical protein R3F43_10345 [bacterium]
MPPSTCPSPCWTGLAAEVAALPAVTVPLGTGRLTLAARAVRLRPAPDGRLGFTLDFDLRDGRQVLFSLAADAEVAAGVDPATGHLRFALGPESLRELAPRLGPEARAAVTAALRRQLPPAARLVLTPARLGALADQALARLTTGGYALLRDQVLVHFVEATQVDLGLPPIPLSRVDVRSSAGWLALGLHAKLPTEGGLRPAGPPRGARAGAPHGQPGRRAGQRWHRPGRGARAVLREGPA